MFSNIIRRERKLTSKSLHNWDHLASKLLRTLCVIYNTMTRCFLFLKLPPQQDRDAIMVLHLGGTFGDKAATIDRFCENYKKLPQSVKNRIVLENDDVSWSVHDLLPVCEQLNIPLVLDFHHHNIIFDSDYVREGTKDIIDIFPRIKATWDRKQIRQKMHYSEPTSAAVTGRQRRKHNNRPSTLPPLLQ